MSTRFHIVQEVCVELFCKIEFACNCDASSSFCRITQMKKNILHLHRLRNSGGIRLREFRSISLVKVSSVECWLYLLAPTSLLHSTVSTTLKMCPLSYRAASTPLLAKVPQHTECRSAGEKAVSRLNTNTIRLLWNHTGTISRCGVPGLRAISKRPTLRVSENLWVFASLPSYVTSHFD